MGRSVAELYKHTFERSWIFTGCWFRQGGRPTNQLVAVHSCTTLAQELRSLAGREPILQRVYADVDAGSCAKGKANAGVEFAVLENLSHNTACEFDDAEPMRACTDNVC